MPKAKTLLNAVTVDLARARANAFRNQLVGSQLFSPSELRDFEGQLIDGLNPILTKWKPSMRRGSRGTRDVLETGRFKNMFETGTSSGNDDKSIRREVSDFFFGPPEGMKDENRELYGYLRTPDRNSIDLVDTYGPYQFNFSPNVSKRMTVTNGDSFMNFIKEGYIPSSPVIPGEEDTYINFLGGAIPNNTILPNKDEVKSYVKGLQNNPAPYWRNAPYFEAQFHGGLTTDDVTGVDVHGKWGGRDPKTEAALKQFAIDHGLKIRSNGKCVWNCKDGK